MVSHSQFAYPPELAEFEKLSEIERRFVINYVLDPKRNGTQAAVDAGVSKSRKTAASRASEFVRNCEISKAVRAYELWIRSEENLLPRAVARLSQLAFEDRYVVRPEEDKQPVLPGLEDAYPVQVKHADSIAAMKLLLQITGLGEAERVNMNMSGAVGVNLDPGPAITEFIKNFKEDAGADDEQA